MLHRRTRSSPDAPPAIATRRLVLRPLGEADAFEFAVLGGAIEVASMIGHIPYPLTVANARDWIAELPLDGPERCVLAVRCRDELVGVCGFAPESDGLHAIGYFIGKPHWGRGFATEAARAMVARCFAVTGSRGITANHFVENAASARVLEKLGFSLAGGGRSWCPVHQSDRDTLVYLLTPAAFRALPEVAFREANPL